MKLTFIQECFEFQTNGFFLQEKSTVQSFLIFFIDLKITKNAIRNNKVPNKPG